MSFYTSLSGLKGAQSELATVSNNIANVGSYGFKKSRTEFGDIVSSSKMMAGQGTRLKGIEQQFSQGGVEATSDDLDLLISGSGFFITRDALTGGNTVFTRNGSFGLSTDNYLIDSSGAFVQAYPVDPEGNALATGLTAATNLEVPRTIGVSQATTAIDLAINLPTGADLPADRPVYTPSNPYDFDRLDPNSYNYAVRTTVYDSAGKTFPATVYLVRTKGPDGVDDTSRWEARTYIGAEEVLPSPQTMVFDVNGARTSAATLNFDPVQPAGAESPIDITIALGTTNQTSNRFGATIEQDGVAAGKLNNVSVGDDGLVTATYSNGQTRPIGKLAIANFSNPAGLKQLGDARWSVTGDSGTTTIGEAGAEGLGRVQSGALERANVDVTEELVALISAQRNFQANAKAIETAGTMTQAIINMRS